MAADFDATPTQPRRNPDATPTPRDVGAVLGAAYGTGQYLKIQNVDSNARLFLRESGTALAPTARANIIEPGEFFTFGVFSLDAQSSFGWWAWSDKDQCACIVHYV